MSQPNRDNPYSFEKFIEWRKGVDYYKDDKFFHKVIKLNTGREWKKINEEAEKFSAKVSFRWRDMAETISRPENRPFLTHYDAYNNRVDRIERPRETLIMEKEIFSEALFSVKTSPWTKLVKMFLIYQNGEACVACPLTCTEGLVTLVERHADTPELKRVLQHCKEGINGDFGIGAQYLSEIQGGSDVPANLLEAEKQGDVWRLYGDKFFCSAAHADYALVTAKPVGSDKIAVFIVPSWLPGDKENEIRNGHVINRLKWKIGTGELPTAEISYNGAVAYPVGPPAAGLANIVGIVLSYSRLTVGLSAAAGMIRASREARQYCRFREAFGLKIGQFPLVKAQTQNIEKHARRTLAGTFKLYREVIQLGGLGKSLKDDNPQKIKQNIFNARELIMLQKIAAAWDSADILRQAMSLFGGHGVIEDFSSLPRLYRDAAVNELWEGPRNVLLSQIHRDFQRASSWCPPAEFIKTALKGSDQETVKSFSQEITELMSHPDIIQADSRTVEVSQRWDNFCRRLYHAYQDLALEEVNALS